MSAVVLVRLTDDQRDVLRTLAEVWAEQKDMRWRTLAAAVEALDAAVPAITEHEFDAFIDASALRSAQYEGEDEPPLGLAGETARIRTLDRLQSKIYRLRARR